MVDEGDDRTGDDEQEAGRHAEAQDDPDGGCEVVCRCGSHRTPFRIIPSGTQSSRTTKTLRMTELGRGPSSGGPATAPTTTPMATGPATNGSTSPRWK